MAVQLLQSVVRSGFVVPLIVAACVPTVLAAEAAANYPTKPVRIIIANTTGTSVDTLARVLAVKMGDMLGQQMVADNRGGAGGIIGAEITANAAPDGYTLLVSSTGMQVITPQLYKNSRTSRSDRSP